MASETDAKIKSYPVLERIRHNGRLYEPGDAIDTTELSAKDAKPLVDAGILGKLA